MVRQRWTWGPERKVYSDKPLHNWASHFVDALRTFAVSYREPGGRWRGLPEGTQYARGSLTKW